MVDPPIILTLNMNEELLLKKYMDYFAGIGFEIEPFGGREYAVRGVPANLFSIAKKELLTEMIDGLSEIYRYITRTLYMKRWHPCPARQLSKGITPCPSRRPMCLLTSFWTWKIPMPAPTADPPLSP